MYSLFAHPSSASNAITGEGIANGMDWLADALEKTS